jgi:hypothetical protein
VCAVYFHNLVNTTFPIIWCVAFRWLGQTKTISGRNEYCTLTGGEGHAKKAESICPPFFSWSSIPWHTFCGDWYQRYSLDTAMTGLSLADWFLGYLSMLYHLREYVAWNETITLGWAGVGCEHHGLFLSISVDLTFAWNNWRKLLKAAVNIYVEEMETQTLLPL